MTPPKQIILDHETWKNDYEPLPEKVETLLKDLITEKSGKTLHMEVKINRDPYQWFDTINFSRNLQFDFYPKENKLLSETEMQTLTQQISEACFDITQKTIDPLLHSLQRAQHNYNEASQKMQAQRKELQAQRKELQAQRKELQDLETQINGKINSIPKFLRILFKIKP